MAGDRVRDEAERLVVAALSAISASMRAGQSGTASATRGNGAPGSGPAPRSGIATGSAECCVCPVCRAIAAMREPSSELADRLATGVGDLATGVAAILRTLSARGGSAERSGGGAEPETPDEPLTSEGDELWENLRRRAAEAARAYGRPSPTNGSTVDDPWRAATREPSGTADEPAPVPDTLVPRPTLTKKAPAKKAPAKKAPAKKAVAKKAVAKKAVAKKAAPRDGAA